MNRALGKIALEALELPRDARADLASRLILSLEETHDNPKDVERAWKKEVQRRMKDVDAGRVKMVPLSRVMERVRKIVK